MWVAPYGAKRIVMHVFHNFIPYHFSNGLNMIFNEEKQYAAL